MAGRIGTAVLCAVAVLAGASAGPAASGRRVAVHGRVYAASHVGVREVATSARLVPVIVKLAEQPSAHRAGRPLDRRAARAATLVERRFVRAAARLPGVHVGARLRVVFGGVAVRVPASALPALGRLPGVVGVYRDPVLKPAAQARRAAAAGRLYARVGGRRAAGRGIVVAVLDTGVWPEHRAFAARGVAAPNAKARPCDFGDNPQTRRRDVYRCTGKIVAGKAFLAGYTALYGRPPYPGTARDPNGHGTLAASIALGQPDPHPTVLHRTREPFAGVAPAASLAVYRVCGPAGCLASDAIAGVQQAIADGARVIAFPITGAGVSSDPVERAFLDAYRAGVLVVAAAADHGPALGSAEHGAPWALTVGAVSGQRASSASVALHAGSAALTVAGASIGDSVAQPTRVVSAAAVPGYTGGASCSKPAAPGAFAGAIVICERNGANRVVKSFDVRAGGGVGMLLLGGAVEPDANADTPWVTTVQLDVAASRLARRFVRAHAGVTATISASAAAATAADVVTPGSGRGPSTVVKPDLVAPGVQVLGATTLGQRGPTAGPHGERYAYAGGTAPAAAATAGAAATLLADHPGWGPGDVRSALATTGAPAFLDPAHHIAAGPLDAGGGRVRIPVADAVPLVFDESAARFASSIAGGVAALDLDLPSVLATDVGASATTTRTATSVVGDARTYTATADPGGRFRVTVTPARFTVPAHGSVPLRIQIDAADASAGWHATTIRIHLVGGGADLHLPVAFRKVQPGLQVATACTPDPLGIGQTGTCTLTATNLGAVDATVHLKTSLPPGLALASASGATPTGPGTVETHGPLVAARPAGLRLRIALPNEDPGFVDLGAAPFNVQPIAVGDETAVVLTPGPYTLLGQHYTTLTVASNGLAIAGSTTSPVDISATPRAFPDPQRPNAVFAPFWTDLDGSGADGIRATQLTDAAGHSWLVVQWNVTVKGTGDPRVFELWLGLGATTTSFFTYDLANLPSAAGLAGPLSIGFEDATGSRGDGLGLNVTSTHDLELGQLPATPPGILSYGVGFTATAVGVQTIATTLDSAQVPGTVVDLHDVTVHP